MNTLVNDYINLQKPYPCKSGLQLINQIHISALPDQIVENNNNMFEF